MYVLNGSSCVFSIDRNCNDSAKDALASALRHSRRHAQGSVEIFFSITMHKFTIFWMALVKQCILNSHMLIVINADGHYNIGLCMYHGFVSLSQALQCSHI